MGRGVLPHARGGAALRSAGRGAIVNPVAVVIPALRSLRRVAAAAVLAGVATVAALPACYVDGGARCDYVVTRCRTVCDYWCDAWEIGRAHV